MLSQDQKVLDSRLLLSPILWSTLQHECNELNLHVTLIIHLMGNLEIKTLVKSYTYTIKPITASRTASSLAVAKPTMELLMIVNVTHSKWLGAHIMMSITYFKSGSICFR